ncbi:patatin-like phospholipase family protein [Oscillospiraceae bacterium OttesenSCG-928-G22]|nr:patatin-like phospholipase family protein [Oscillospiraceae bacterium OttesenSCG-928-G22]
MIDAGLILEGGGMRGLYTIGVLDLLLDEGLLFSHIYGVSAGACHAMSYISGQRGRAMKTVTEYIHDRRYASVYSLLTTGDFFGGKFNYRDVPERLLPLDFDAYETRGVSMRVVVTNCRTGEAEYIPLPDARKGMIYV